MHACTHGWMCGWTVGWMSGMRQEGDFLFNGHFTPLKTKFKNKTADVHRCPVVKNPSANAGTQLPFPVQENSTRLRPTRPMSHNDRSPHAKRLCAYTGEATAVRGPWTTARQQPTHSHRDLAEPR